MGELLTVSLIFTAVGILFIALSIPLINRRIPPNHLYGFRVPAAFASEQVWYDINEYSARMMRRTGIVVLIAALLPLAMRIDPSVFTIIMLSLLLGGVAVMIILSFKHLHTLTHS